MLREVIFGNELSVTEFQAWAQLNYQTGTIIMTWGKVHSRRPLPFWYQLLLWDSSSQQCAEYFNDAVAFAVTFYLTTLSAVQAV
jgi:hypothetical protein